MAYNNFYPTGYQPMMYQPQQNNGGLIWVQGIEAAKSYLVAPNTTVTLWDTERDTVYIKSTDSSGMPTLRVLDYKPRENETAKEEPTFATKDELSVLKKEIKDLKKKLEEKDDE